MLCEATAEMMVNYINEKKRALVIDRGRERIFVYMARRELQAV
jgi:hypothetical protein